MDSHLIRNKGSEQARLDSQEDDASVACHPKPSDAIVVSRKHMEQLHRHVNLGYGHFPNRHIRQSLRILQHILTPPESTP